MTLLRTLKALILGETWLLPLGVAAIVLASAIARSQADELWRELGGLALLGAIGVLLVVSVRRSARPRR